MSKTLVMGSFDAEKYWRPEGYSKLPELEDKNAAHIIACMDELLFPLCNTGDLLLNRFKMNPVFKSYLEQLGFEFSNNRQDLYELGNEQFNSDKACVFELLSRRIIEPYFQEILEDVSALNTYAILPATAGICGRLGIKKVYPEIEIIKKVNSKIYSHKLHDRLGLKKYGTIINRGADITQLAAEYDDGRGIILKDAFGVSGKGNVLISSPGILKRIADYIVSQEKRGLQTCFILETYLEKQSDFSCQIKIDPDGKMSILSIQNIINNNFSYAGSMTADQDFVDYLDRRGYFTVMQRVAGELFKDGYSGDVCIDSMILTNGEIVPVVEINARKSMGLINHYLDHYLSKFSLKGYFFFFMVGFKGKVQMDDILNKLDNLNLLFKPNCKAGIIPLSCNSLFINRELDSASDQNKTYKGRLYITAAANCKEESLGLVEKTKRILDSLSFTVYN